MAQKWVYHSDSRDEYVDIMELDVIHAIRILRKYVGQISDLDLHDTIFGEINEQSTQ
jgi:hypothetical protein